MKLLNIWHHSIKTEPQTLAVGGGWDLGTTILKKHIAITPAKTVILVAMVILAFFFSLNI